MNKCPKMDPWGSLTFKVPWSRLRRNGGKCRRVNRESCLVSISRKRKHISVKCCWLPTLEVARFPLFLRTSRVFKWMVLILFWGYSLNIHSIWTQTLRPMKCVFLPNWPSFAFLHKQESRTWTKDSTKYARSACSLSCPCPAFESINLLLWLSWTASTVQIPHSQLWGTLGHWVAC